MAEQERLERLERLGERQVRAQRLVPVLVLDVQQVLERQLVQVLELELELL